MKTLTENLIEEDGLRIEFIGWTKSENPNYSEFSDVIRENLEEDNEKPVSHYVPKTGKEDYVEVNDFGIFKWTCSFRFWGGMMEYAGNGLSYCDWAWESPETPVTPDKVEEKNFLIK